jgi:hypothetical protein
MDDVRRNGPAPSIDETGFVPRDLDEARQLYDALVKNETPVSQSRGIVTWLIVHTGRRADDPSTDKVRADYRRQLGRLGAPPWGQDPNRYKGA